MSVDTLHETGKFALPAPGYKCKRYRSCPGVRGVSSAPGLAQHDGLDLHTPPTGGGIPAPPSQLSLAGMALTGRQTGST